jgi:hypothetical protein
VFPLIGTVADSHGESSTLDAAFAVWLVRQTTGTMTTTTR